MMTAQSGRDFLLKLDRHGDGDFITIAGLRSQNLSFNSEIIDVTHQQSIGAWRELLGQAAMKTASIKGAGIFRDEASDEYVRALFFSGEIKNWQICIPDFGRLQGPFQITGLYYQARHDGEINFDMSLESAGLIQFMAQ